MNGNRNFAELAICSPGYKKNVKTLTQYLTSNFEFPGPGAARLLAVKCLAMTPGSQPRFPCGTRPKRVLPKPEPESTQIYRCCNMKRLQHLARPKMLGDCSETVTNHLPPCQRESQNFFSYKRRVMVHDLSDKLPFRDEVTKVLQIGKRLRRIVAFGNSLAARHCRWAASKPRLPFPL